MAGNREIYQPSTRQHPSKRRFHFEDLTGIHRKGPRFVEPYASELQAVVNYYTPVNDYDIYFTVVDSQNENWDAQVGSYDYSISWTAQPTGNCNLF
jgi:hypothetical protein